MTSGKTKSKDQLSTHVIFHKDSFCSMTLNYPPKIPKTHSLLSSTPSIISFPLKSFNIALHLSQIFYTTSTSLLHGISYFFISLIFEMRRSKIGLQSIGETVRIVYYSEREKFDQRSHFLVKLELFFQFVLNY